jgi:hypothetical protein
MRFEDTILDAIRFRAESSGARFMSVDTLNSDLGGPADFDDALTDLHARGLITLHPAANALTLTERGSREPAPRRRRFKI